MWGVPLAMGPTHPHSGRPGYWIKQMSSGLASSFLTPKTVSQGKDESSRHTLPGLPSLP